MRAKIASELIKLWNCFSQGAGFVQVVLESIILWFSRTTAFVFIVAAPLHKKKYLVYVVGPPALGQYKSTVIVSAKNGMLACTAVRPTR